MVNNTIEIRSTIQNLQPPSFKNLPPKTKPTINKNRKDHEYANRNL